MKFLLFDKNEKLVKVLKDEILDAIHTEEINGEDTLMLEVENITIEKNQRVLYFDKLGFWKEFIVKGIEEIHNSNGLSKELYCESSFYETLGDFIEDKRSNSTTATAALMKSLENTRWEIGNVDDLGINSASFYQISSKESVQKVAEAWNGEIRTRISISGTKITHRYVDLLHKRGVNTGKRFEYKKNIVKIDREILRDDVITALYGFGKGEELETGGYSRKIDFSSINNGKKYLEKSELLEEWGRLNSDGIKSHIFGKVDFSECEDIEELKELTQKVLDEISKPQINYEAEVNIFDLDYEGIDIGDEVIFIDKEFKPSLRLKSRIIKMEKDLLNFHNTKVTFGQILNGLTDSLIDNDEIINNFKNKEKIWDKADNFGSDGTINASFVNGLLEEFNSQTNATGGFVYHKEGQGIITMDKATKETSTMAVQILGGIIRIANSKLPDGEWNWTTALNGGGIIADTINAGTLKGGKVHFNLEDGTFLIGNSISDYSLLWDGSKLFFNGQGIEAYATKSEVTDAVSSIEIAQRNYILYSDYSKVVETSYINASSDGVLTLDPKNDYAVIMDLELDVSSGLYINQFKESHLTFSQEVSLEDVSTIAEYDVSAKIEIIYKDQTTDEIIINDFGIGTKPYELKTSTLAFAKEIESAKVKYHGTGFNGKIIFFQPKLEFREVATIYIEAPEDVKNKIDSKANQDALGKVNDIANLTQSELELAKQDILNKANKTDLNEITQVVETQYNELKTDATSMEINIGSLTTLVDNQDKIIKNVETNFKFDETGLSIGKKDNPLNITISNDQIDFVDNGNIIAYVNGQKMFINSLEVLESMIVGSHKVEKYDENFTIVRWVGQKGGEI